MTLNLLNEYRVQCFKPSWIAEVKKAHYLITGYPSDSGASDHLQYEVPKLMKLPKLEAGFEGGSPFLTIISKIAGVYMGSGDYVNSLFGLVKSLVETLISDSIFNLLSSPNSKSTFVRKLSSLLLHVFPYEFIVFFHFKLSKASLASETSESHFIMNSSNEQLALLLSLRFSSEELNFIREIEEEQLDIRSQKSDTMTASEYFEFSQKRGTTFLSAGKEVFVGFLAIKGLLNVPLKNISWVIEFLSYTLTKLCSNFAFLTSQGKCGEDVFNESHKRLEEYINSISNSSSKIGDGRKSIYERLAIKFWEKELSIEINDSREWKQLSRIEQNDLLLKAKADERLLVSLVEEGSKRKIMNSISKPKLNYEEELKYTMKRLMEEKVEVSSLQIYKGYFQGLGKRKSRPTKKSGNKKRLKKK